ncbi:FAD:protein FMN transferase [Colwelliaceae bacterium BS250]
MTFNSKRQITTDVINYGFKVSFKAMASPCEVLINNQDKQLAEKVGRAVAHEAWRIEDKYSRYLATSACSLINANAGSKVDIDAETYKLLLFAQQCYEMSDGMFDITSGILRKAWKFDGSDQVPNQQKITPLLQNIGWHKVILTENTFKFSAGMEIDLGGLGKEYAVDTSLIIANKITSSPVLINFGGDIATNKPLQGQPLLNNHTLPGQPLLSNQVQPWKVGIEHPGFEGKQPLVVSISNGAIATSGDANRFLLKDGQRYSHILNPKTGWSITEAPKSISVCAPNCIQAGFIATLALLQGKRAEQFLQEQSIGHWCVW